ncbi:23203_t:CDS:2, partial [Cetraspora pellucida]
LFGLNTNDSFSISQNDFSGDLHLSNNIEFVNTDLNEIKYQNDVLELDSELEDEMLELEIGLSFFNWSEFKTWLNKFAKQKRFNYKVTYECSRSGVHNPQVTCDPTNQRNFRLTNNPGDFDASQMLQTLLNFKESDPLWVVKPYLEPLSRRLSRLLWMSLSQHNLYKNFHDISQIIALAIIDDETLDSFQWIFTTIFDEPNINSGVIFTDSNSAIISVINEIYPNMSHLLCIFHVDMNLRKKLKTGVQNMQKIESINKLIHDKVDWATSLCDLLITIDSCVKNGEQFEKFEIEHNVLPRVGLPSLNNRFFKEVDNIIKQFLIPIILGKQCQQMNQSVCYDVNHIVEWNQLIAAILEIWNICATRTTGIGHYIILLNDVATYSHLTTFYITLIPSCWYLEPNTNKEMFFQQIPTIAVCGAFKPEEDQPISNFTFKHLFAI